MSDEPWHDAVAYALVGQRLNLGLQASPSVDLLLVQLAERGWARDPIAEHARLEREASGVWPHAIPSELRAGLGAAQLLATVAAARDALLLTGFRPAKPTNRTVLTPDERRLLAEVPPHHIPH